MGHKDIGQFNDSQKYLKYRNSIVAKSLSKSYDDSWARDKNFLRSCNKIFYCKWCSQEMYAAEYDGQGSIIMSCRKPLCPGNIDGNMKNQINHKNIRHKEMTNQYLFDTMCKF